MNIDILIEKKVKTYVFVLRARGQKRLVQISQHLISIIWPPYIVIKFVQ